MAVLKRFTSVELLTSLLEVPLHHVDVVLVSLVIHAGITDNCNAILVEALRDLSALEFPVSLISLVEKGLEVDDRYVLKYEFVGQSLHKV